MRQQFEQDESHRLFQDHVRIGVVTIDEESNYGAVENNDIALESDKALAEYLQNPPAGQHVFFFLYKSFTYGPFDITASALNTLLNFTSTFSDYNNLFRSFIRRTRDPKNARLKFSSSFKDPQQDPSHFEICYNIYHIEENHRGRGDPWSLREIGVYSQTNDDEPAQWIFIDIARSKKENPSTLGSDMYADCMKDRIAASRDFRLHLEILRRAARNWPDYLDHLGDKLDNLDDKVIGSNADEEEEVDFLVSFADCQTIHYIQTKLRTAKRALGYCGELADRLGDDWKKLNNWRSMTPVIEPALNDYKKDIVSLQESVDLMLERAGRISHLLSQIMEVRNVRKSNQASIVMRDKLIVMERLSLEDSETNKLLADIATEAHKDSVALKSLTLIATIYLPASLCATIFSSNLVENLTAQDSSAPAHFVVATDFWIFAVLALGLTIFTMVLFHAMQRILWRSHSRKPLLQSEKGELRSLST